MESLRKYSSWLCAGAMGLCLLVYIGMSGLGPAPTLSQWAALIGCGGLAAGLAREHARQKEKNLVEEALAPAGAARFCDLAGFEEAVEEMRQLARFLRDPAPYVRAGARLPRGVLLYGPPGTGKTLLARALAGEAGVPFLQANGSDFVQMYVGVGAKRIRELFRRARGFEKCVIFIDEIDALGKKRGNGEENAERDQTLNALLSEMCGFDTENTILVVAATNRPDVLDEALVRPGRFDRRIELPLPDLAARRKILRHHLAQRGANCDAEELARLTAGFSGAGLESLVNEAAMLAAEENSTIGNVQLQMAFVQSLVGKERKSAKLREEQLWRVAVHEAGHALCCREFLPEEPILLVSVVPTTRGAGGYVLRCPAEGLPTRRQLLGAIRVALAGRAAEEIVFGRQELSAGAANDLKTAESLARSLAYEYALEPDAGLLPGQKQDEALLCRMLDREYAATLNHLGQNRQVLQRLAHALCEQEQMDGRAVLEII